ncbi:MAG: methyltransferase family protein [Anaerolineae bacterium]
MQRINAERVLSFLVLMAFQAAILFLTAGTVAWGWAWAYLSKYLAWIIVAAVALPRLAPGSMSRALRSANSTWHDRVLDISWTLLTFVVLMAVAGLDKRMSWSKIPGHWVHLLGALLFAGGLVPYFAAFISRVREAAALEQGGDPYGVCRTGPYAFVRHPGHTGAIIQGLALPLLLGSWWALIPGVIAGGLLVWRTLRHDLRQCSIQPEYADYAHEVPWRLLRGLW